MIISKNRKLIVGLDIGTTKIVTLVGEILIDNTIKIIGVGICSSNGIDKGRINNLDSIVTCIQESINKAEKMADCRITSLYLSLSNEHVCCQNEMGIIPISEDEVTQEDINNVIYTAKSVKILHSYHILHVIPQEYSIDQHSGINNPIGLSGVRMKVNVHLITCHKNTMKNLIKAVEKCDVKVDQVVFSGIASSLSVLTEDEKKMGVCMIDIGSGTIDFTIYINGSIQHSQVIPYAGDIVTSDISYAFNLSHHDAENIKIKYSSINKTASNNSQNMDYSTKKNDLKKEIPQNVLIEVIEARYVELLSLIQKKILNTQNKLYEKNKKCGLLSGIVLTGGGSKISCITEYAEKVFHKKIRIAKPINMSGLIEGLTEPEYSTAIGLLHYAKKYNKKDEQKEKKNNFLAQWFENIKNWIAKEF